MNFIDKSIFGLVSLALFFIGIVLDCIWLVNLLIASPIFNNQLIGILFYLGILCIIASFIIGIIGLIKDKNKVISIISISILLLLLSIFVVYEISYISTHGSKEIEIMVDDMIKHWL